MWLIICGLHVTILYIIHRPDFHWKHNVSETGFCLRLEVERTPKPYWCCCWCPETETSSIYWAQLSRFHLKTDRIQSPKHCVLNRNRAMDNVQNWDSYINIPLSQTYRSYMVYTWDVEAFTLVMQSNFRLPTYLHLVCVFGLLVVCVCAAFHPSTHLFIYSGRWPKLEIYEIIIWGVSMPYDALPSYTIWRHVDWHQGFGVTCCLHIQGRRCRQ
jgi:hypothetical protein